jgi:hypothetical protein
MKRDRLTRATLFAVLLLCASLAGCAKPADNSAHPAPDSTYQGDPNAASAPPVGWDEKQNAFTQNGKPLKTWKVWRFAGSTEGFTALGTIMTAAPGGGLSVANKVYGAPVRTPANLGLDGRRYPVILVRITRDAAGAQWDPIVYYTTDKHAETELFKANVWRGHNPATGETTVLVYDMSHLLAGGPDWTRSTIKQIRFQTDDQPGGAFTIREVAVAEKLPQ